MCLICVEYIANRMTTNEVLNAASESKEKYQDEDHESEFVSDTFDLIDMLSTVED